VQAQAPVRQSQAPSWSERRHEDPRAHRPARPSPSGAAPGAV
ncbi:MAG: hypothetical protein AVDCRST_MAG79-2901, partial [uncultured Thermoleophilia bacterium]